MIGGQLQEKSRYGSLAVGAFHDGAFRYVGQVGNSLTRGHSAAFEQFLTRPSSSIDRSQISSRHR